MYYVSQFRIKVIFRSNAASNEIDVALNNFILQVADNFDFHL